MGGAAIHVMLGGLIASASAQVLIGFQEGARHLATCANGGYVTGLDLHFGEDPYMYTDAFVQGVKIRCSSGKLDIQYKGLKPDDHMWGGKASGDHIRTVVCPAGSGVAAMQWRSAHQKNAAPLKVAGVKVFCGSETSPAPVIADLATSLPEYTRAALCSGTEQQPPSGPSVRLRSVAVWGHQDFTGIEFAACEVPGALAVL